MNKKNPYESLKLDSRPDASPVDAQSTLRITESSDETIIISTSVLPDGLWVYGFNVYWRNGRVSASTPSGNNGIFRTQREAQLYAVGYMKMFLEYFTPESRSSLMKAETALIQTNLFD